MTLLPRTFSSDEHAISQGHNIHIEGVNERASLHQ